MHPYILWYCSVMIGYMVHEVDKMSVNWNLVLGEMGKWDPVWAKIMQPYIQGSALRVCLKGFLIIGLSR